MAYEQKAGQLSLFKNDRKEKDTHPDYKGQGMDLDGRPVWISAWLKKGANGTFMSVSLQPKEDRPQQGGFQDQRGGGGGFSGRGAAPVAGRGRDDARVSFIEDSEIPF